MTIRYIPFFLALILLVGGCRENASSPASAEVVAVYGHSQYLLSVEEVAALLDSPTPPLLLEISKAPNFAEEHLPGAINLWRPDYEDDVNYPFGGMEASRKKMASLLSGLGAKPGELIVVYCTKGSADAARLLWILRGYGHERVGIMNGGKAGWQHAGYPLTREATAFRPRTNYTFAGPEVENYSASIDEVLAAIGDTNTVIVDCREDYEYLGAPYLAGNSVVRFKKGAFAAGAIPGARHLNWSEAVDLHSDHTFKSLDDLNHNFLRKGISPDKQIIVYCQSGVRSAHTAFVLKELLGYPNVKNYDGSWIEWSYFYGKDTSGKIQHHTSPEKTEIIYRELMVGLENPGVE